MARFQGNFDVRMLGDKRLSRELKRMAKKVQAEALRPALRASAKRIRDKLLSTLDSLPARTYGTPESPYKSGGWRRAQTGIGVRALKRSRRNIGYGVKMPTRAQLGIPRPWMKNDANWYYPFAVEYGYKRRKRAPATVPPARYIRDAIDDNYAGELQQIRRDVWKTLPKVWAKPVFF